ncbi:hypothetical protein PITC_030130 [Penicillium italicum]|uniref:Myb-like DNA-binding domain-containing protein n=1 Tax=Penicillium italicum TaxID=40296 RepID=A0A0A2L933_PENIT|nr:hypothetical protein PITC_030130 [Penicillium italicum]
MAPVTNKLNTKGTDTTKTKMKVNIKAPAEGETEVLEEENEPQAPKACDEVFLLTLLDNVKVDHETAAKTLGINKAACRMRFIRLQQKYGFKKKGPKGTPRKKVAALTNKEAADEVEPTPANESNVTEEGETVKGDTVEEPTEN